MLAPLTDIIGLYRVTIFTKKKRTKASDQKTFEPIKSTIAHDTVLAYPDFKKEFEIYTDASTRQLGN